MTNMQASEARAILHRLGWNQVYAASRLGVCPRTMRNYLSQHGRIPAGPAMLLRHLSNQDGVQS